MRNYTFRLQAGQDLFDSISLFIEEKKIQAGDGLSVVGSLTRLASRFANQDVYTTFKRYFEIVSITIKVSVHGSHLSSAGEEASL